MNLTSRVLAVILVLTVSLSTAAPVLARSDHYRHSDGDDGARTSQQEHRDDDDDDRSKHHRVEAEGRADIESQRFRGWWWGNLWRSWHDKDRSEEGGQRTDTEEMQRRQAKLDERVAKLNAAAQSHQARLDILYGGVKAYVTDNTLTVENYDSLIAEVDNYQATSAANIEALVAMNPQHNPEDPEDKSEIAAYRDQYKRVIAGLIDYKKTLHVLVEATIEASLAEEPVEAQAS